MPGHFLPFMIGQCKTKVIGAFNRKLTNYMGSYQILKTLIKIPLVHVSKCNWLNVLGTLEFP
jgi:hypothetical protein